MEAAAKTMTSTRSATDELREKVTQLRHDVQDLSTAARHAATEEFDHLYKEGREKARVWEKSFEDRVRAHPIQSVAIAAGAGFLAGYLISRRW